MRKGRLFALAFGVLLAVALVVHPANAQTNQNQANEDQSNGTHGFFFGAGMSSSFFSTDRLNVYSDFWLKELNPAKIGAYYEVPLGMGNFFAGLEAGYASRSLFGGGGEVDFLPINLNATFAFNIADILYIGPTVKAGFLGLLGHSKYNMLPLLGAALDLELRFRYFPLSIYAQGGINAYPTTYNFGSLPTVEVGLRFPRGVFRSGDDAAGGQTGSAARGGGAAATVTNITVNPATATVNQGATQQFNATVTGTNNPPQTVTWAVTGGGAGTSISPTGLLTVAANQTPGTLTVTATSTADASRSATANVTVPAAAGLVPGGTTGTPTVTNVFVNPSAATVNQGATQQFSATVTGTNNPPQTVTWAVTGGGAGTSISPTGLLTVAAAQAPGTLTVTATSTADTTRSGTATVTVPAGGATAITDITVTPATATVNQGATQQFNATVTGTNNPPQTVTWAVTGGGAGTSISPTGLLTVAADQTPGTLTVTATSTADTTRSGTATVTVPASGPPAVTNVFVNPSAATVNQGATQQFSATVTGTNNPPQTVTWAVTNGGAGTSISPTGLLTVAAAQAPGTLTVTATSTADSTRSGTATVTVPAPPPPPTAQVVPPPSGSGIIQPRRDVTDVSKQSLFAEIHFEPDTAVLIESGRPQLDAAARHMQANPGLWILVRTYTAPFGTTEGRFMVALERGRFVRDYLTRNFGIAADRILLETLASEQRPLNAVAEEWITYRTAELIMIAE